MNGYKVDHVFTQHKPKDPFVDELLDEITEQTRRVANVFDRVCPDLAAEKSTAFKRLREAAYWAKAAVMLNQDAALKLRDGAVV